MGLPIRIYRSCLIVCLLCLVGPRSVSAGPREDVIYIAGTQVGVQEKTGHNDGPVDKYLAAVGLAGSGEPYCAAFISWVAKQAGLSKVYPKSALAADMVRKPQWKQGKGPTPNSGDTWGIYFPSKGRVAHTGLVEKWNDKSGVVTTIEANTSPQAVAGSSADRDGDGVWRKIRPIRTIYASQSYLP